MWFVILTDMSLIAAVAASIAILMRRRSAVQLFVFSFAAILITNGYELSAGTSRMLATRAAFIVTILIASRSAEARPAGLELATPGLEGRPRRP
jgi:hypothetical protein